MTKVAVVGSQFGIHFFRPKALPEKGETVMAQSYNSEIAAKGLDTAVGCHRLGVPTAYCGCVGEDEFGKRTFEFMDDENMTTKYVVVDKNSFTGVGTCIIEDGGQNYVIVARGANDAISKEDIDKFEREGLFDEIEYMGTGLEINLETMAYAVKRAHAHGVKVLLDPAPVAEFDESIYPCLEFIKPNETEASVLTGIDVTNEQSAIQAARWFLAKGVKHVIVTLGANGVVFVDDTHEQYIPSFKVKAVDASGAGDTFGGAFLAGMAKGYDIADAIVFANVAAGISVTKVGCIESMPRLDEVEQFIKDNNIILASAK